MAKWDSYKVELNDSWTRIAGKLFGDQSLYILLMAINPEIKVLKEDMEINVPWSAPKEKFPISEGLFNLTTGPEPFSWEEIKSGAWRPPDYDFDDIQGQLPPGLSEEEVFARGADPNQLVIGQAGADQKALLQRGEFSYLNEGQGGFTPEPPIMPEQIEEQMSFLKGGGENAPFQQNIGPESFDASKLPSLWDEVVDFYSGPMVGPPTPQQAMAAGQLSQAEIVQYVESGQIPVAVLTGGGTPEDLAIPVMTPENYIALNMSLPGNGTRPGTMQDKYPWVDQFQSATAQDNLKQFMRVVTLDFGLQWLTHVEKLAGRLLFFPQLAGWSGDPLKWWQNQINRTNRPLMYNPITKTMGYWVLTPEQGWQFLSHDDPFGAPAVENAFQPDTGLPVGTVIDGVLYSKHDAFQNRNSSYWEDRQRAMRDYRLNRVLTNPDGTVNWQVLTGGFDFQANTTAEAQMYAVGMSGLSYTFILEPEKMMQFVEGLEQGVPMFELVETLQNAKAEFWMGLLFDPGLAFSGILRGLSRGGVAIADDIVETVSRELITKGVGVEAVEEIVTRKFVRDLSWEALEAFSYKAMKVMWAPLNLVEPVISGVANGIFRTLKWTAGTAGLWTREALQQFAKSGTDSNLTWLIDLSKNSQITTYYNNMADAFNSLMFKLADWAELRKLQTLERRLMDDGSIEYQVWEEIYSGNSEGILRQLGLGKGHMTAVLDAIAKFKEAGYDTLYDAYVGVGWIPRTLLEPENVERLERFIRSRSSQQYSSMLHWKAAKAFAEELGQGGRFTKLKPFADSISWVGGLAKEGWLGINFVYMAANWLDNTVKTVMQGVSPAFTMNRVEAVHTYMRSLGLSVPENVASSMVDYVMGRQSSTLRMFDLPYPLGAGQGLNTLSNYLFGRNLPKSVRPSTWHASLGTLFENVNVAKLFESGFNFSGKMEEIARVNYFGHMLESAWAKKVLPETRSFVYRELQGDFQAVMLQWLDSGRIEKAADFEDFRNYYIGETFGTRIGTRFSDLGPRTTKPINVYKGVRTSLDNLQDQLGEKLYADENVLDDVDEIFRLAKEDVELVWISEAESVLEHYRNPADIMAEVFDDPRMAQFQDQYRLDLQNRLDVRKEVQSVRVEGIERGIRDVQTGKRYTYSQLIGENARFVVSKDKNAAYLGVNVTHDEVISMKLLGDHEVLTYSLTTDGIITDGGRHFPFASDLADGADALIRLGIPENTLIDVPGSPIRVTLREALDIGSHQNFRVWGDAIMEVPTNPQVANLAKSQAQEFVDSRKAFSVVFDHKSGIVAVGTYTDYADAMYSRMYDQVGKSSKFTREQWRGLIDNEMAQHPQDFGAFDYNGGQLTMVTEHQSQATLEALAKDYRIPRNTVVRNFQGDKLGTLDSLLSGNAQGFAPSHATIAGVTSPNNLRVWYDEILEADEIRFAYHAESGAIQGAGTAAHPGNSELIKLAPIEEWTFVTKSAPGTYTTTGDPEKVGKLLAEIGEEPTATINQELLPSVDRGVSDHIYTLDNMDQTTWRRLHGKLNGQMEGKRIIAISKTGTREAFEGATSRAQLRLAELETELAQLKTQMDSYIDSTVENADDYWHIRWVDRANARIEALEDEATMLVDEVIAIQEKGLNDPIFALTDEFDSHNVLTDKFDLNFSTVSKLVQNRDGSIAISVWERSDLRFMIENLANEMQADLSTPMRVYFTGDGVSWVGTLGEAVGDGKFVGFFTDIDAHLWDSSYRDAMQARMFETDNLAREIYDELNRWRQNVHEYVGGASSPGGTFYTQAEFEAVNKQIDQARDFYADSLENAVYDAAAETNRVFVDYGATSNLENILRFYGPFTTWQLRNPLYFAQLFAERPSMLGLVYRYNRMTEIENRQRNLTNRFEGMTGFEVGETPDAILKAVMAEMGFDYPDEYIIPPGYYAFDLRPFMSILGQTDSPFIPPNAPDPENKMMEVIQQGVRYLQMLGVNPWPWVSLVLEEGGVLAEGETQYSHGPQQRALEIALRSMGHLGPSESLFGENQITADILRYNTNRRLVEMVAEGAITEAVAKVAKNNPSHPAFQEAQQFAFHIIQMQGVNSLLSPFRMKYASVGELEILKDIDARRNLYNDPELARWFNEQHPHLALYSELFREPLNEELYATYEKYNQLLEGVLPWTREYRDLVAERQEAIETLIGPQATSQEVYRQSIERRIVVGEEDYYGNVITPEAAEYTVLRRLQDAEPNANEFIGADGEIDWEAYNLALEAFNDNISEISAAFGYEVTLEEYIQHRYRSASPERIAYDLYIKDKAELFEQWENVQPGGSGYVQAMQWALEQEYLKDVSLGFTYREAGTRKAANAARWATEGIPYEYSSQLTKGMGDPINLQKYARTVAEMMGITDDEGMWQIYGELNHVLPGIFGNGSPVQLYARNFYDYYFALNFNEQRAVREALGLEGIGDVGDMSEAELARLWIKTSAEIDRTALMMDGVLIYGIPNNQPMFPVYDQLTDEERESMERVKVDMYRYNLAMSIDRPQNAVWTDDMERWFGQPETAQGRWWSYVASLALSEDAFDDPVIGPLLSRVTRSFAMFSEEYYEYALNYLQMTEGLINEEMTAIIRENPGWYELALQQRAEFDKFRVEELELLKGEYYAIPWEDRDEWALANAEAWAELEPYLHRERIRYLGLPYYAYFFHNYWYTEYYGDVTPDAIEQAAPELSSEFEQAMKDLEDYIAGKGPWTKLMEAFFGISPP